MISLPSTIRQYSMIQAREATLREFKGLHNSQTVVTCNLHTIPLRKTLVKRRLVASRIAHHQFHSQWAKIHLQAKLWAMSSLIQYCQVPWINLMISSTTIFHLSSINQLKVSRFQSILRRSSALKTHRRNLCQLTLLMNFWQGWLRWMAFDNVVLNPRQNHSV